MSFAALLESNRAWFEWIEGAGKFEGLLKDKIPWTELDSAARALVQARMNGAIPARQVLLNSFYLTMVSGFEEFLREKIREATRNYSSKKKRYSDIANDVRTTHVRESARLLRRIDSPPDYLVVKADDLCRGLGSCVPDSEAVVLNADAFADVESLVLLETFMDRVKIFGVSATLDSIADIPAIKEALNVPRARARESLKALQAELVEMRRNRNRIAHTGGNAADVTSELLSAHRNLLHALSSAIDQAVR